MSSPNAIVAATKPREKHWKLCPILRAAGLKKVHTKIVPLGLDTDSAKTIISGTTKAGVIGTDPNAASSIER